MTLWKIVQTQNSLLVMHTYIWLSKLFMGVRHISAFMKSAFMVMALSWLAWFPFFMFYTVGWEKGDPLRKSKQEWIGSCSVPWQGVQEGAFGLSFNSIVQRISSLLIAPLCWTLGSQKVILTFSMMDHGEL